MLQQFGEGLSPGGYREELRKRFLAAWREASRVKGSELTPKEVKPLHDEYMREVKWYEANNPAIRHGGGLD